MMDTIFAQASAYGKAGVSIIRVSGSSAKYVCETLTHRACPLPRKTILTDLSTGSGDLIDRGLIVYFEKNASFTGEDVVEFQVHGSVAVVSMLLSELSRFENVRLADPGEFTRRALENGCLDLTQVDGLADLIDAETEAQHRQALRVFDGELGKTVDRWRLELIRISALLQVSIDFSDEELPTGLLVETAADIATLRQNIELQIKGYANSERIRNGYEVAIIGRPNVGKSTLLNALAGRTAAITSETAGTTRDVIEVRMNISGLPVTFLDTAGIRETTDGIEEIGVDHGLKRAALADIRLFLLNDGDVLPIKKRDIDIVRRAKCDDGTYNNGISGISGFGIPQLLDAIFDRLKQQNQDGSLLIRERHRTAMLSSVEYLASSEHELTDGQNRLEIVAEELRSAILALDSLVGNVGVEDILDEVFSRFCLGK